MLISCSTTYKKLAELYDNAVSDHVILSLPSIL